MSSNELIVSDQAQEDLTEIWLYIAADSPTAADSFLDLILEKCSLLCQTPQMGRSREELLSGLRSFPCKRYVVFYRIGYQTLRANKRTGSHGQ